MIGLPGFRTTLTIRCRGRPLYQLVRDIPSQGNQARRVIVGAFFHGIYLLLKRWPVSLNPLTAHDAEQELLR